MFCELNFVSTPCLCDEPEEYYPFETSLTTTAYGFSEENEIFDISLKTNEKTGLITTRLFVHGDHDVECNLKYNIGDLNDEYFNVSGRFIAYRVADFEEWSNSTEDLPYRLSGMDSVLADLINLKLPSSVERKNFLLLLKKDEFFVVAIKIWDVPIWEKISNVLRRHPEEKYKMSFRILLKVEDLFYPMRPSHVIDAKEVGFYNKLKENLNKKESPEKEPKTAPCEMIVFNENGDIEVSISPVEKASCLTINLTEVFGDDKEFFNNRFALDRHDANTDRSVKSIDGDPDRQSKTEKADRIIDIGFREKIGKSSKIWDISIWPEICSKLNENRTDKYRITYPVHVIVDGKPINYEAVFEIDNRTMNHMERLKRTAGKNSDRIGHE